MRYSSRYYPILIVAYSLLLALLTSAILLSCSGEEADISRVGTVASKDQAEEEVKVTGFTVSGMQGVGYGEVVLPDAATAPAPQSGALSGKIICIDPGHAANADPGTEPIGPGSSEMKVKDPGGSSGVVSGTPEHVITLAVAEKLKQSLEAQGAQVVMTRRSETYEGGNRERAQVANAAGAHLFIRIHCDGSGNPEVNGVSTLYPAPVPGWTDDIAVESQAAAAVVQEAMAGALAATDKGIVPRNDITGFNWSDVPSILVEIGFLSSPAEDTLLNSPTYQQQVAEVLSLGIMQYFS